MSTNEMSNIDKRNVESQIVDTAPNCTPPHLRETSQNGYSIWACRSFDIIILLSTFCCRHSTFWNLTFRLLTFTKCVILTALPPLAASFLLLSSHLCWRQPTPRPWSWPSAPQSSNPAFKIKRDSTKKCFPGNVSAQGPYYKHITYTYLIFT